MKKLLQLLNEYEKVIGTDRVWGGAIDDGVFFCTRKSKKGNLTVQHSSEYEAISQIISKKFGFIQWLVVNDKTKEVEYGLGYTSYSESDNLIRLLSIQDDPIEFLVFVLR